MTPRRRTSRLRMTALLLLVVAALLFADLVRLSLHDHALRSQVPLELRGALVQVTGFESYERRIEASIPWKFDARVEWGPVAFGDFLKEGELDAMVRNEDRTLTASTLDGTPLKDLRAGAPISVPLVAATTMSYQQWFPVTLQRPGRDLLLVLDSSRGTLLALDAKTERSIWETPLPETTNTAVGQVLTLDEEGETRGLLVLSTQSRHLFFLSAEGELLAKTNLEAESLVFEGTIDEAPVVFAAEPSGHIRMFGTEGNEQQCFRLRYPEGLSPLSLIAVEGEDGSPALRADFMNRRPFFYSLNGEMLSGYNDEPCLIPTGWAYLMRTTRLPNGNILLASMYRMTLLNRYGRIVDQLHSDVNVFLLTGARSSDGRYLTWTSDQMNYVPRLSWVEVRE